MHLIQQTAECWGESRGVGRQTLTSEFGVGTYSLRAVRSFFDLLGALCTLNDVYSLDHRLRVDNTHKRKLYGVFEFA